MNNNKGILVVIALLLVAILGAVVYKGGFLDNRSPIEKAGDSIGEAIEEVGDEIDDHTSPKN